MVNDDLAGDRFIKVILPIGEIPLGATVTKIKGEKTYTLVERLRVFGEQGERREIVALEGTCFIVDNKGDANAVSFTTEIVWRAPVWQLLEFLDPQEDK